jgi:excisionase family DNA binding protein
MPETENRLLLNRGEAAALLGISVDTLDLLIARRRLRTVRFGRSLRIPRREIDALVGRLLTDSETTPRSSPDDDQQSGGRS